MAMTYAPGERIGFWFADSIYGGEVVSIEDVGTIPIYVTNVDTKDGQPFDHPDYHRLPVWSDMHIWRESDGPSAMSRAMMEHEGQKLPEGLTARPSSTKEKSAAVRAALKQAFPSVKFSVTTEGRGTAYGHTYVRWNADIYPQVDRDAVRAALVLFDDTWSGPTRNS